MQQRCAADVEIIPEKTEQLPREMCIVGDFVKKYPKNTFSGIILSQDLGKLVTLFKELDKIDKNIIHFLKKKTCKYTTIPDPKVEDPNTPDPDVEDPNTPSIITDQTLFHLLSRPVSLAVTAALATFQLVMNKDDKPTENDVTMFVNRLYERIVENPDQTLIQLIIDHNNLVKNEKGELVHILDFKSYQNGKTALETARCDNSNTPRIKQMADILTKLEKARKENHSQSSLPEDPRTSRDSQSSLPEDPRTSRDSQSSLKKINSEFRKEGLKLTVKKKDDNTIKTITVREVLNHFTIIGDDNLSYNSNEIIGIKKNTWFGGKSKKRTSKRLGKKLRSKTRRRKI